MKNKHIENLSGKFIVIDGPDGAGKGTQMEMTARWIAEMGMELVTTRDPGGTEISERIRQILLDTAHEKMSVPCELLLYMAGRAQLWEEIISPALNAGKCVLCDRWVSSTIAYQGAGGMRVDDICEIYRVALMDAQPDLTIILDIDAQAGLNRCGGGTGKLDRMESKDIEFHGCVRKMFLEQAQRRPDRFAVVNADADRDEVNADLRNVISQRFLEKK